jgi:hypothetical protein
VTLKMWRSPTEKQDEAPDASIAERFTNTFKEPLSVTKREAMRELFPSRRQKRVEQTVWPEWCRRPCR